ncbi:helix-turn-helix domain-containing protein, partial [Morganella morganii]|uniref:helix-turn-helix domain-containing protein n=1 Tax=Morganella morganii TaxID=582 RepID=UPI003CC7D6A2
MDAVRAEGAGGRSIPRRYSGVAHTTSQIRPGSNRLPLDKGHSRQQLAIIYGVGVSTIY